ncbi:MAG: type II secretion system protein [Magnetococcales bacterium]|nr:type II secretion system protein [Magnetococcales bacterium]
MKRTHDMGGFSLLETLLAMVIIAIMAGVTYPTLQSHSTENLAVAARSVAAALRYAQSESVRQGQVHGVYVDHTSERVYVYRMDTGSPPDPDTTLYHPVDKKLYDFTLGSDVTGGTVIANASAPFTYTGLLGAHNEILFDTERGLPYYDDGTSLYPLINGDITISQETLTTTVRISVITGRVTIL